MKSGMTQYDRGGGVGYKRIAVIPPPRATSHLSTNRPCSPVYTSAAALTVGTYSEGNLLVVYEMRRQVYFIHKSKGRTEWAICQVNSRVQGRVGSGTTMHHMVTSIVRTKQLTLSRFFVPPNGWLGELGELGGWRSQKKGCFAPATPLLLPCSIAPGTNIL